MKKGFNILLIIFTALTVMSCDKTKSYTDMLKAERKAIDRLIDREGIEVLSEYPADGVFKENQYVKLQNGIYLNVIDSGTGKRPVLGSTEILCRFIANRIMGDSTQLMYDLITTSYSYPVEFKYGYNVSIVDRSYAPDIFICEGLGEGLNHVGDSSIVKLIVPFKRMSQTFAKEGEPIYFSKVKYIFR